jgi:protein TonB
MERNKLLCADYLDILFDGRNKSYGGYELRSRYGQRARKACISVIAGALIAAAIPVIASSFAGSERVVPPVVTISNLTSISNDEKPKDIPAHVVELPRPAAAIRNPEFKIEHDELVYEKPATIDEVKNKQVALETSDSGSTDPGIVAAAGGNGRNKLVESGAGNSDRPLMIVDQMPQFDGDIERYLQRNLHYPEEARLEGITGMVGIQFVVNEDGSISQAEVVHKGPSSLEAEALRVVRAMPRWKPGRQGDKAVKVYFRLPITFTLD